MDVKELWRFARLLGGLFSERIYSKVPSSNGKHVGDRMLLTIVPLIQRMWLKSGITFTISYWAEVLRLVVQYLDPRAKPLFQQRLWIKTHKRKNRSTHSLSGLPIILPLKVKLFLNAVRRGIESGSLPRGQLIRVKLLLTLLSFFRACSPSFRKVSWDSIVKPNLGDSTLNVVELEAALKSLGITTIKVGNPSIFYASSKAGPNFPVATIGLGLDLIGWIMRPRKWYEYCLICLSNGYFVFLTQFLFFSILVAPIALFCYLTGIFPLLGHIAVLPEARGKMRKIGITDFWTQILFRPLHDAIYAQLAKVPNDGTNNQVGPIVGMLGALNLCTPGKGFLAPLPEEIVINGITVNRITLAGIEKLPLPLQDIVRKSIPKLTPSDEVDRYVGKARPKLAMKGRVQTVQSLDLTAATDRLPVELQAQILTLLGYPGDL